MATTPPTVGMPHTQVLAPLPLVMAPALHMSHPGLCVFAALVFLGCLALLYAGYNDAIPCKPLHATKMHP